MPSTGKKIAVATAITSAAEAFQGFNYGASFTTGAVKQQTDYEQEFQAAQDLPGTNGAFNSARIYTMIQGGTPNDPISAIPAAIKTKTSLLFGLWASAGDDAFSAEIEALTKTIDQYCDQLDGLVAGISVGSEDLYRESPTGIENGEYAGASPDTLVRYIQEVRDSVKGSCLADAPIGHVDTWTAYVNGSNSAVIEACDWIGMDAYAYFESTKANSIENGKQLFQDALDATKGAVGSKPVWITETGWPVSGKDFGDATASPENARTFYEEAGCPLFESTNTWWYTLLDAAPDTPNPSFGVIAELGGEPLYDLSCDGASDPPPEETTKAPEPEPEPTTEPAPEPTMTSIQTEDWPPTSPIPTDTSSTVEVPPPPPSSSEPAEEEPTEAPAPEPEPTQPTEAPAPEPEQPTEPQPTEPQPTEPQPTEAPQPTEEQPTEPTVSSPPQAGSVKLNSFGAAAVAVLLAVGLM